MSSSSTSRTTYVLSQMRSSQQTSSPNNGVSSGPQANTDQQSYMINNNTVNDPHMAGMLQNEILIKSMLPQSMLTVQITPSSSATGSKATHLPQTSIPDSQHQQQKMSMIPQQTPPQSYFPNYPYAQSLFPFFPPITWLTPSQSPQPTALPHQPGTSKSTFGTPDSGIGLGTPSGIDSSPSTLLTPQSPYISGQPPPSQFGEFNPLTGCYSIGSGASTGLSSGNVPMGASIIPGMSGMIAYPMATSHQQHYQQAPGQSSSTPITTNSQSAIARKRKLATISHRQRRNYCSICQSVIHAEGRRSQGPRRHVLQFHVMKPLYRCRLCEYSSPYDKYHIASHAKRVHATDRLSDILIDNTSEFEDDIQYWTERCFDPDKLLQYRSNAAFERENVAVTSDVHQETETPNPKRRKVHSFAVEDLLADDDDCSERDRNSKQVRPDENLTCEKGIDQNERMKKSTSVKRAKDEEDCEESEEDAERLSIKSPITADDKGMVEIIIPKRLFTDQ
ncbi:unnamed protein product [Anisakis simplex]|uniref:C2H2-type domain-containing protein n=1 Tax=Anisakis simplex TaxID=6269 RepID=A0A158PPR1_ANISI|nr:unnamed protein product [Anisakis simplex]